MIVFVSADGRYLTALHCVIRQKVWKKDRVSLRPL